MAASQVVIRRYTVRVTRRRTKKDSNKTKRCPSCGRYI